MTLVYRQEYRKLDRLAAVPEVLLPQEWLLGALPQRAAVAAGDGFRLLAHCTEKANASAAAALWGPVFARAGLALRSQASGCCGMSGTYGHEARNLTTSKVIFEQSWGPLLDGAASGELLATGYSCRSQVDRLRGRRLRHPIEVLLQAVQDRG